MEIVNINPNKVILLYFSPFPVNVRDKIHKYNVSTNSRNLTLS
jgi:hypothetical protein